MTKMGMMIVGTWAGEQLLVWTMGVVLLVTVGVGLLSCVCCVRSEVARQPRGMTLRSMRNEIIHHLKVTKRETWILSWYSGDQMGQLMMSNTRSWCGKLVQFLRHVASTNENPTNVCPILVLS